MLNQSDKITINQSTLATVCTYSNSKDFGCRSLVVYKLTVKNVVKFEWNGLNLIVLFFYFFKCN